MPSITSTSLLLKFIAILNCYQFCQDFTLEAANVELIVEDGSHFRILGNRSLTVRGPFVLDADPLGWTQGEIIDLNEAEMTIDAQIFEGYAMPTKGERIEIFTPEGLMLPHGQDAVQVEFIFLNLLP